jgi:hypothetical protein
MTREDVRHIVTACTLGYRNNYVRTLPLSAVAQRGGGAGVDGRLRHSLHMHNISRELINRLHQIAFHEEIKLSKPCKLHVNLFT